MRLEPRDNRDRSTWSESETIAWFEEQKKVLEDQFLLDQEYELIDTPFSLDDDSDLVH